MLPSCDHWRSHLSLQWSIILSITCCNGHWPQHLLLLPYHLLLPQRPFPLATLPHSHHLLSLRLHHHVPPSDPKRRGPCTQIWVPPMLLPPALGLPLELHASAAYLWAGYVASAAYLWAGYVAPLESTAVLPQLQAFQPVSYLHKHIHTRRREGSSGVRWAAAV